MKPGQTYMGSRVKIGMVGNAQTPTELTVKLKRRTVLNDAGIEEI